MHSQNNSYIRLIISKVLLICHGLQIMVTIAPGAEMPRKNLNHHTMVRETTKEEDDFFDNFQDKLEDFSQKKPCLAFRNNINNSINMGFKWILQSWY